MTAVCTRGIEWGGGSLFHPRQNRSPVAHCPKSRPRLTLKGGGGVLRELAAKRCTKAQNASWPDNKKSADRQPCQNSGQPHGEKVKCETSPDHQCWIAQDMGAVPAHAGFTFRRDSAEASGCSATHPLMLRPALLRTTDLYLRRPVPSHE